MADPTGRGSARSQRRQEPALAQRNTRQPSHSVPGRPSLVSADSSSNDTEDVLEPYVVSNLRTTESRFSLNEQFAASRREIEFDIDDSESVLGPAPPIVACDGQEDLDYANSADYDQDYMNSESFVRRLLLANDEYLDYYALLGLSREPPPTGAQIRAAYHRLSLALHPDKHPPSLKATAEKHFTKLQKAYETLIESRKRIIYDLEGEDGVENEYKAGGCMGKGGEADNQVGVRTMDASEFKSWFTRILSGRERRNMEELIGSKGACKVILNATGLFDKSPNIVKYTPNEENLNSTPLELSLPPVRTQAMQLRQSFSVPLPWLNEMLRARIPSWTGVDSDSQDEDTEGLSFNRDEMMKRGFPKFTFTGAIGGYLEKSIAVKIPDPDQPQDVALPPPAHWYSLSSDNIQISTSLSHSFPDINVENEKGSIASAFRGTDVDITTCLFPKRTLGLGLGKPITFVKDTTPFYCYFQTYFNHSARLKPPISSLRVSRTLGSNQTGYFQWSSGDLQWPTIIRQHFPVSKVPLWLPRGKVISTTKIGYIWSSDEELRAFSTDEDNDMQDLDLNFERTYMLIDPGASLSSHESWHFLAESSPVNATVSAIYARDLFVSRHEQPLRSRIRDNGEAVPCNHQVILQPPEGVRLEIEANLDHHASFGGVVRAVKRIGSFTSIGLGIGLNQQRGLYVSFSWSRLGQNVIVPIILLPKESVNVEIWLWTVAIPWATYVASEFIIIRPWQKQRQKKIMEKKRKDLIANVAKRRIEAEQASQLMRPLVEYKQALEREQGGLVILSADYGIYNSKHVSPRKVRLGEVADVTIALAALVEAGQLSIPRGTHKSQIIGFWDPAPLMKKVLVVKYLYAGTQHCVECTGSDGLHLPLRDHAI